MNSCSSNECEFDLEEFVGVVEENKRKTGYLENPVENMNTEDLKSLEYPCKYRDIVSVTKIPHQHPESIHQRNSRTTKICGKKVAQKRISNRRAALKCQQKNREIFARFGLASEESESSHDINPDIVKPQDRRVGRGRVYRKPQENIEKPRAWLEDQIKELIADRDHWKSKALALKNLQISQPSLTRLREIAPKIPSTIDIEAKASRNFQPKMTMQNKPSDIFSTFENPTNEANFPNLPFVTNNKMQNTGTFIEKVREIPDAYIFPLSQIPFETLAIEIYNITNNTKELFPSEYLAAQRLGVSPLEIFSAICSGSAVTARNWDCFLNVCYASYTVV
ncbi:hypothetical protein DID88_000290 [Monilinia fructigena]|uniref:Uncharacterized protein n=1 Tax=Monilinia fructigena TaxID=38457 RepID=A0A395IH31_9HELO|nr:hypothetical protein DID88_000290 [Monilinia fructigena]